MFSKTCGCARARVHSSKTNSFFSGATILVLPLVLFYGCGSFEKKKIQSPNTTYVGSGADAEATTAPSVSPSSSNSDSGEDPTPIPTDATPSGTSAVPTPSNSASIGPQPSSSPAPTAAPTNPKIPDAQINKILQACGVKNSAPDTKSLAAAIKLVGCDGSFLADIDGDGQEDIVMQDIENTYYYSHIQITPSGAYTANNLIQVMKHGGTFVKGQSQFADVDGDGKDDLVFQNPGNYFYLSASNGSSLGSPLTAMQHGDVYAPGHAHYADFDGDGKDDLVFQSNANQFYVSFSSGVGFGNPVIWLQHGGSFMQGGARFADIDGDGKADLFFQGFANTFHLSLSTGTAFGPSSLELNMGGDSGNSVFFVTDVNGDSKADFIFMTPSTTVANIMDVSLAYSNGDKTYTTPVKSTKGFTGSYATLMDAEIRPIKNQKLEQQYGTNRLFRIKNSTCYVKANILECPQGNEFTQYPVPF